MTLAQSSCKNIKSPVFSVSYDGPRYKSVFLTINVNNFVLKLAIIECLKLEGVSGQSKGIRPAITTVISLLRFFHDPITFIFWLGTFSST